VDEPAGLPGGSPVRSSRSKPASPSSETGPAQAAGNATSPITSPVSPISTNDLVESVGKVALEHPPDSPYLEFAKPASPPASPPAKAQAPVPRKVTSPIKSRTKPDVGEVSRPVRSSSLAPGPRPSRSPSPTPSMVHRPATEEAEAAPGSTATSKSRKSAHARRTVVGLPANPPPAPENEESSITYGSVTLGSHSETNLLDAAQKNKPVFSAVVHRKVTENPGIASSLDLSNARSVPDLQSHARRAMGSSRSVAPGSLGHGDLEDLLAEAALLEERLKRSENGSDISIDADKTDPDGFQLEPLSVPAIATPESYDDESHDQVPPPPPPKGGYYRMLSGLKKLAGSGSLRSTTGSHSRVSTSGSELSSEDSASLGTPSDNGIPFPMSHSERSLDRPDSRGSVGFGYPSSVSSKKTERSTSRASSFAEKIWHRGRTKSNNSNAGTFLPYFDRSTPSYHLKSSCAERGQSSSPRKNVPLSISTTHSKLSRSNTQPPTLPPILTSEDNKDLDNNRPVSWQSQSSTTSTNTTSTVSPGGKLFTQELFDSFPSVPQEVPIASPGPGTTTFSRTSYDVARSATLPLRTRRQSAQKLG
jgi:hypothetical protein